MAFHVTEGSRGVASILQVPSKPDAPNGAQKLSGMGGLSPMTPRTPGADSWRLGTTAAEHYDDAGRAGTPMRTRKATTGPPGWMVSAAGSNTFDASGVHMRAHIQSLANLDKEVLAEKLFHAKVQKMAHVYSRRLEATLARQEMQSSSGIRSLSPAAAGERRTQSDIVRNLKSKNRMLRQERNKALALVNKLQKTVRIAYVHELEAEVRVLQEEVANQQALATAAREKLRMSIAHGTPALPTRFGTRPHTSHTTDGRRRLAEVLQELQVARRTLEREGQKLRDACSHLSTADAVGQPEMKTALKVILFLQEHTVKMVEHLTSVPQSEALIASFVDLGVVAPAPPSDTPSPLQLDSLKLPSSLTALAAPFATAVARVEALTAAEVEQDPWLHDTLENFTVIAQKFVEVSSALRASPASEQVTASGVVDASIKAAASDDAPGEAPAAQEPADAATAADDDPASKLEGDLKGVSSVSLCPPQQTRTESSNSAYDSSAAGSSDGSVAAGSVSVNHTGINDLDIKNNSEGDRCMSEKQEPLNTGAAGDCDAEEVNAAPDAEDRKGSADVVPASVASVTSANEEQQPVEPPVAESVEDCRGVSGDLDTAVSGSDKGVGATVVSAVDVGHVGAECEAARSIELASILSSNAAVSEMKNVVADGGDEKGDNASMNGLGALSDQTVDTVTLPQLAEACSSGAGAEAVEGQLHNTADGVATVLSGPDAAGACHDVECHPELEVVNNADLKAALAQSELQDADPADVPEGVEEEAAAAEEGEQTHEEAAGRCDLPEAEENMENVDLLEEEGPPPLELPDLLGEPGQDATHPSEEQNDFEDACSEVLPEDKSTGHAADGADYEPNVHMTAGKHLEQQLVRADDIGDVVVPHCTSGSLKHHVETPGEHGEVPVARRPSLETDAVAAPVAYDRGNGRETRESEVAEGMVNEVLEETLASMLSVDAQQFAQ